MPWHCHGPPYGIAMTDHGAPQHCHGSVMALPSQNVVATRQDEAMAKTWHLRGIRHGTGTIKYKLSSHGISTALPWTTMASPWHFHGIDMAYDAITMNLHGTPWQAMVCHGDSRVQPMALPWTVMTHACHGLPWHCHGLFRGTSGLPWAYSVAMPLGSTMAMP